MGSAGHMVAERAPHRYILPDVAWACLLDGILRDAPTGAVIEVHTAAMEELVEQALQQAGRHDVVLCRAVSGGKRNGP